MSSISSTSLDNLPVELIYYLFNYLDVSTIFVSFRYVCKRFYIIVNSFSQYKLDMRLISKINFDHICRIISPEKISSLILSDDLNTPYQIRTFLSRFSFQDCSRLRSLNLIKITENNLFTILMQISECPLNSLAINCFAWDTFSYTVRLLLASTIEKCKLEKLHLNITYRDLDVSSWSPLPITLKHLQLEHCTFQEYCMILRHTINLQELTLTKCIMYNIDGSMYEPFDRICPINFHTFSFGACFMRMKELCIILSCIPTVQHLKLIIWTDSLDSVINGSEWERFVSENLSCLTNFQFFFDDLTQVNSDSLNLQSYIQPFQTSFWLEKYQWYVACDYIKTLSGIRLYSLPICNPLFMYYTNSLKISASTLPIKNHSIESTKYVNSISLNLNEMIESDDEIQMNSTKNAIFQRIDYLSINFDGKCPYTSSSYLRTLIDLSSIVRLTIQLLVHNFAQKSSLNDYLSTILQETSNIHTLKLQYIHNEKVISNAQSLCTIIPRSIKHLQISISNFNEVKMFLEQLQQLFSISFYSTDIMNYYEEIEKWMKLNRPNSICRHELRCIQIWLGNYTHNEHEKPLTRRVLDRLHRKQLN